LFDFFSGHLYHLNFEAAVKDLFGKGLRDGAEVLLSGDSAGGMGTFINVDWLADTLPWASVKGAPVAGYVGLSIVVVTMAAAAPFPSGTQQFNDMCAFGMLQLSHEPSYAISSTSPRPVTAVRSCSCRRTTVE